MVYNIKLEVYFEVKDSEVYGGLESVGYASTGINGGLGVKRLISILFGRFDGEPCPYCGSTHTLWDEYHHDWLCRKCGKYF